MKLFDCGELAASLVVSWSATLPQENKFQVCVCVVLIQTGCSQVELILNICKNYYSKLIARQSDVAQLCISCVLQCKST